MNCSYCIVPKTRGRERARPINAIIEEVEELAANGTKEITFLGQIVTSYGRREIAFKDEKSPFVQLLEKANEVKGIERIRFTSPHPRGFKEDLIQAYGYLDKLCEYVHLPAQSFSDKVLKAMNRPYSTERYRRIVDDLREVRPDMYFSTDIIVGFPGETEEDFELTRKHFEEIGFDMAYIFKYSIRIGTEAETMGDQVAQKIKEERNQVLLKILEERSLKRNESLVGTIEDLLVESPARRGAGRYIGRTRGHRKVIVSANDRLLGEVVPVRINKATASTLFGELANSLPAVSNFLRNVSN